MNSTRKKIGLLSCLLISTHAVQAAELEASDNVLKAPYRATAFKPDPFYDNREYDERSQLGIYGDKSPVDTPRALLELGYPIYQKGPIPEASYWLGKNNPVTSQFSVYGDLRFSAVSLGESDSTISADMNLEVDWKLTGTERIHLSLSPLRDEEAGEFTRIESLDGEEESGTEFNLKADGFFFEGDIGSITGGFSDEPHSWNMPFAFGKIPLEFQNGYYLDDAITGAAIAVISRNSPKLNISNYDVSLFAGIDDVDQAFPDDSATIVGVSAYLDAHSGHWEINAGASSSDTADFTAIAVGFTKRYGSWLSNSLRVLNSSGSFTDAAPPTQDDDLLSGTLVVIESSLITANPSTYIPYLNIFAADGSPQQLAGKNNILEKVGITFESNPVTLFSGIDPVARNNAGLAIGLEYLFKLDQQFIIELGYSDILDDTNTTSPAEINDTNLALGLRYQKNINTSWAYKIDFVHVDLGENGVGEPEDSTHTKFEIFTKF